MAKKKDNVLDEKMLDDKKSLKIKKAKENNKEDKKNKSVKKDSFFKGVKSEFKKVRWPNKKEMIKNSIATITFILFFALFFYLIEVIIFFIKQAM